MYFYKKRGLQEPETEPVGLKSYMLVRVALDVNEDEWFGVKLGQPEAEAWDEAAEVRKPDDSGRKRGFLKRRRERKRMREEAQRREALLAEREGRIQEAEASIQRLAGQVAELAGEGNVCYCVYESGIRKKLLGKRGCGSKIMTDMSEEGGPEDAPETERDRHQTILPVLWQRYFDQSEFTDYSGRFWVEQLMPEAVLPHFVILGTAACIPEIIEKYAGGMKSLKWILPEAGCTEEVQGFVEDFYIESGLAVSLQTLSDAGEFRKLRQICVLPSNILDFTEEPNINTSGAAPGSIWLDMQSVEEKRRRILGRSPEIACFSMKEKWKYAQRRCKSPVLP